MSVKRMSFSAAEKLRVALEAIKGEMTMAEISAKYLVHATQISKWKKQALDYMVAAFNDKLKLHDDSSHDKELSELYQQIGQLKVENDFLKKKCNLFSR